MFLFGGTLNINGQIREHVHRQMALKTVTPRQFYLRLICCYFLKILYLFIYFGLCWVFVTTHALSLQCLSFSWRQLLLLQGTVCRVCGLQQLWCMGLVAPWHVESSQTRDQTYVFCTGRQIANHWTTRKFLLLFFIPSEDKLRNPIECLE